MNAGIVGLQDSGKSLTAVATVVELVEVLHYYKWDEVYGNLTIRADGYHKLSNAELRAYTFESLAQGYKHHIKVYDEVDRVFPARFFKDKQQTEQLIGFWQDQKMFDWNILTYHPGNSIDKILRDSLQAGVVPTFDRETDTIELTVIDGLYLEIFGDEIHPASAVMPWYDRWELIL